MPDRNGTHGNARAARRTYRRALVRGRLALASGAMIAMGCTAAEIPVGPVQPRAVVNATLVAGQPVQTVLIEWSADGARPYPESDVPAPDTNAVVSWTAPDGRELRAVPLWPLTHLPRDRGVYGVASSPVSTDLKVTDYRMALPALPGPGLALAEQPGTYLLHVITGRGDTVSASVRVWAADRALRVNHVTDDVPDTLTVVDTMPAGFPMSLATQYSRGYYATMLASGGVVRIPMSAMTGENGAQEMFPRGTTNLLLHYAVDSALARSYWTSNEPMHADGEHGNVHGALGVAGYALPLSLTYVTRP